MNKSSGCILRVIILFLVAIITLVFVSWWFLSLEVEGVEFSPDDFSLNEFSYTRSTIFFEAYNLKRSSNSTIGMSLASSNLITTNPAKTFHLVSDNRTDPLSRKLQASILVRYLDLNRDVWVDWNTKNPKLAGVMWPIIQAMAYDRLYILTPDVFDQAIHKTDKDTTPEEFQHSIRSHISDELFKMIEEQEVASNESQVILYKKLQSKYSPSSGPILAAPTKSSNDKSDPSN